MKYAIARSLSPARTRRNTSLRRGVSLLKVRSNSSFYEAIGVTANEKMRLSAYPELTLTHFYGRWVGV
ncbi:hypothetical protein [Oscillatoria sp. FACHB-1406]|uniref:hypothetical protein n=1 Tax=Oscillatoria sp. FACHB-1406 TaxID=2692846 RepID=UPI001A7F086D|nr:hypothetical protein [Oscillatoria sp. FACHB-1406]